MKLRTIVIYTRYSSDMQSPKSCVDQERDVRNALTRQGIDHRLAIVIYDEAESGTKTSRPEAQRLEEMTKKGEIEILAVDDQARFSRADSAYALIKDLVFSGGRFISTGEGIDTTQPGWELRVKVMELHNSTTILELGRRVRRGQRGRIIAGLTAGDYCYGYESFIVHPEKVVTNGRGPKPEKDVRIDQLQASWVLKIFLWFIVGWSLTKIAEELTRQGVPLGRRCRKKIWKHQHVRSILSNAKYIGIWVWGTTTTIRNSRGKVKQIPVPEDEWVRVVREDLRIVDQETWDKAQRRLAELLETYGHKEGQAKRGPRVHHSVAYPSDLMQGLVFCECDARMHHKQSNGRRYLACPNAGKAPGMCSMRTQVPWEKAKDAILKPVIAMLSGTPAWIDQALASMHKVLASAAEKIPLQTAADRKQLVELDQQIETLIDNLSRMKVKSESVFERLALLEQEAAALREKVEAENSAQALPAQVPDSAWIRSQLGDLPAVFEEGGVQAALLLRKLLGKVTAHAVLPPGKQRGYSQLRFRIDAWGLLKTLLPPQVAAAILQQAGDASALCEGSEEFRIDLGAPTKMDEWGPKIAAWRAADVPWKEIWERTGLGSGPAYVCWKRYVDAQKKAGSPPTSDDGASEENRNGDEAA